MDTHVASVVLAICLSLSFLICKRATSLKLDDVSTLQGPRSRSWLYGNMVEFVLGLPAGRTEIGWFAKYGNMLKFHACFGEERLMISDPAAIRYILQNTQLFVKSSKFQLINRLAFGEGSLVYAHGDIHQRVRAIMNPVFSAASVRALTPTLEKIAQNLCDEWTPSSGKTVDAYRALHQTTLYAITEAVMGYDTTSDKEYTSVYEDLLLSVSQRSKAGILTDAIVSLFPESAIGILEKYPPSDLKKLLDHRFMARKISETLMNNRMAALRAGEEQETDLFTTLVRNNEKVKIKMSEDEINSQFGMITVAGEDTTANSLVWVLYTLACNNEWQETLRKEITAAHAEKNGQEIEYDRLPFLNAVIKEVLRFYTAASFTERVAAADAIVPLSTPVKTSSGKTLTEVRIKQGRTAVISITGYNRLASLWGDDAGELNPYRWLDGREVMTGMSIGPYANLLTFIGGPRTCIGWRFATLEIQVVVSHLVRQFSFSLPENVSIQPASAITVVPMDANGKTHLPLRIERL
ncbi:cytochrome P450 [Pholiota molesta]|nr:cytochrome P450 [Pholiota molesta]